MSVKKAKLYAISTAILTVFALFYSVSYDRWRKTGSLVEAAWHSLYFGIAIIVIVDLNQYAQYALPFSLVAKWALFGLVEFLLYGQIARWAYNRLAKK